MNTSNTQLAEQLIQHLRNLAPRYCDHCGTKHSEQDFSFVGEKGGQLTFQIACSECGAMDLLQVVPGSPGMLNIKRMHTLNTDVKGAEFAKFAGKPQVRTEEALDFYLEMDKVEGLEDFLELLS